MKNLQLAIGTGNLGQLSSLEEYAFRIANVVQDPLIQDALEHDRRVHDVLRHLPPEIHELDRLTSLLFGPSSNYAGFPLLPRRRR
jgi:hypothetical protein